ncbi:MAG: 16S rRNA (cytosine(1402)-N(4))-methyltransferase RsmH [Candidatus Gastranaerophilales bacterium]|nr:16S rRNA (cytosine(1402)-N(4))-methyltransferase RsmH [Candidatus Gastranaerophilales bacterium]
MEEEFKHYTVMKNEAVEALEPKDGLIYLDGTLGGGGHSELIAQKISPNGRLISFDIDDVAISYAKKRLEPYKNVTIVKRGYQEFDRVLKELNIEKITGGMLLDLGASYYQLTSKTRGFSFSSDTKLDMRFNTSQDFSAYDLINTYSEEELADVFYYYGEERYSRRLAKNIINSRNVKKIETTTELCEIIKKSLPYKNSRTNPATRIFQALRIEVNGELRNVEETLKKVVPFLSNGAKIVVITFHSLEDRIVKKIFKELSTEKSLPQGGFEPKILELVNKKPICPTDEEIKENPPSRSAKLRIARKV